MSTEEIIQRTRLLDSEIKVGSQPPWQTAKPPQDRPWRSIPVASFTLFSAFAGRHRARGLEKEKRKALKGTRRGTGWWEGRSIHQTDFSSEVFKYSS